MVEHPDDSELPVEEQIQDLRRTMGLLELQIRKNNEKMMGFITVLCLPLSVKKRLEIGLTIVNDLPDDLLEAILDRYLREAGKTEMQFDEIIDPMIKSIGFERLWKLLRKSTIEELFGDFALYQWTEMSKTHPCEGR